MLRIFIYFFLACFLFTSSATARDQNRLNIAAEQFLYSYKFFNEIPDAVWTSASQRALDEIREALKNSEGYWYADSVGKIGSPPQAVDLYSLDHIAGKQIRNRNIGALLSKRDGITVRGVYNYNFSDYMLPWDWCGSEKSGQYSNTEVSIEIPTEQFGLINLAEGSGSIFDIAFKQHLVPAMQEHCPKVLDPSWTGAFELTIYLVGHEWVHDNVIPTSCPGKGSETGIGTLDVDFNMVNGESRREMKFSSHFRRIVAAIGETITQDDVDSYNSAFNTENGRLKRKCVRDGDYGTELIPYELFSTPRE